eukprot:14455710-Alexandrium_andersonii.AAC.1
MTPLVQLCLRSLRRRPVPRKSSLCSPGTRGARGPCRGAGPGPGRARSEADGWITMRRARTCPMSAV